ncbi:MAG: hypothetical protein OXU23_10935 [Candidatus Poribacteria bacterium]|nr:hypothetical protein [Candidatus Poribacteria bacterium]
MKTQRILIFFLGIIVAGVLLAFSTWHQWNANQKTTKERMRPIHPIAEFNHGTSIRDIAFSSTNPELFASAGAGNTVKIWNVNNQDSPHITLETQEDDDGSTNLNGIAFSPTDKWFASKTFWALEFWDVTSGRRINFIKIPASTFAISPEGHYLATATRELKLWDINDPKDIKGLVLLPPEIGWKPLSLEEISIPGPTSDPLTKYHMLPNKYRHVTDNQFYDSIDFSNNGKWIAAGGYIDDKVKKKRIGIIKVWDLRSKQLAKLIKRDREVAEGAKPNECINNIRAINFSPDNRFFAVAANNGLTIWSLPEWNIYHEVLDQRIRNITFSPDGTMYAVADVKGITLWSMENITPIALLRGKGLFGSVSIIAFSADGSMIAGGNYDGVLRLWDVGKLNER